MREEFGWDEHALERAAGRVTRGLRPDQALGLRLIALAHQAAAVHAMAAVERSTNHPCDLTVADTRATQARGLAELVRLGPEEPAQ